MMKLLTAVLSLLLVCLPAYGQSNIQTSDAPVRTIPSLDVPKYLGTWYEIAKFPNWFQRKCVSNTKAVYSLKPDGNLKVLNSCKNTDGDISEAEGTARQIGPQDSPKLEVRFAPVWLLDPQYQVAAISDPRREYLWILSRTPQIDQKVYDNLLQRLQAQQFDLRKLELTPQSALKN